MFNDILINPIYSIISFVLTVISFVLAFVFYYRSQSVKIPCYTTRSDKIVTHKMMHYNPIKVSFQDEPIEDLSVTYIVLWNNGRATINKDDIAQADSLRIVSINDAHILRVKVIDNSKKGNNIDIAFNKDENTALISFDFLDYKDGAIFQIYHTGGREEIRTPYTTTKPIDNVKLTGAIKGANKIIDADQATDVVMGVMFKMSSKILEKGFSFVPKSYHKLFDKAESSQNFLLQIVAMTPMMILIIPFYIAYMMVMMAGILSLMLFYPFLMKKYSMPKELYPTFKYISRIYSQEIV